MSPNKQSFTLDLRIVIAMLLIVIATLIGLWRPWQNSGITDRTVQVTGDAKLSATPDEFVFYPAYEFKGADKNDTLNQLTAKSQEITKQLKSLGVTDAHIKTSSDGSNYTYTTGQEQPITYTLRFTVTVSTQTMAQKVQDYLATTAPTGAVSPQATFSDKKRKQLETQARDEASKDARSRAEQMGKNLGFKLGKVKSINDDSGFGVSPFDTGSMLTKDSASSDTQLQVQPGENDLSYSVSVVYYIR